MDPNGHSGSALAYARNGVRGDGRASHRQSCRRTDPAGFRRFRPFSGTRMLRLPHRLAARNAETAFQRRVTHWVSGRDRCSRRGVEPSSPVFQDAPIGAGVFALERFIHCKTGVYDGLCGFAPVDRGVFADRIDQSENGCKFEEFRRFPVPRCAPRTHNMNVIRSLPTRSMRPTGNECRTRAENSPKESPRKP